MSIGVPAGAEDVSIWGQKILFCNGVQVWKLTSGGPGYTFNDGRAIGMGFVSAGAIIRDQERATAKQWKALASEGSLEVASVGALYDPRGENTRR